MVGKSSRDQIKRLFSISRNATGNPKREGKNPSDSGPKVTFVCRGTSPLASSLLPKVYRC